MQEGRSVKGADFPTPTNARINSNISEDKAEEFNISNQEY